MFHGWIKYGMNGIWQPVCRDVTREGCEELMTHIIPDDIWCEHLVLPVPETPFASIMMKERTR